MRTWALYGRNIRILVFMIGLATVLLGVAGWSLVGQQSVFPRDIPGCHMALSDESGVHLAVAWEALLIFDSMVFVLTLHKTYKMRPRHDFTPLRRINIVSLVLRDGAVYYAVMVLANLANILTFYLTGPLLKGCLSSFASCISVTMMSRLMLNLHSTRTTGILSTFSTSDLSSGVAFTSRAPDLNFGQNSSDTEFELESKAPIASPHMGAEFIVQESRLAVIEEERSGS